MCKGEYSTRLGVGVQHIAWLCSARYLLLSNEHFEALENLNTRYSSLVLHLNTRCFSLSHNDGIGRYLYDTMPFAQMSPGDVPICYCEYQGVEQVRSYGVQLCLGPHFFVTLMNDFGETLTHE
ncbi:unnamed protein product [Discosporangium mesarthrocarpum]